MLNEIEKLIGEHPKVPNVFGDWLTSGDTFTPSLLAKPEKKHRSLDENKTQRQKAIDALALSLIKYHVSEQELYQLLRDKKRELYGKYSFTEHLEAQDLLPFEDEITKKGNLTEVILSEYIQKTSELKCFVYKFRYNSNAKQSMKGDDVLLFNLPNLREKIIVGEAKYRTTPNGGAIEDILDGFADFRGKVPISVSFVSRMLRKASQNRLANQLGLLQTQLKNKEDIPIVLVGLILSNIKVHDEIISHDLHCNYSINQAVINALSNYYKPFPANLSSLIGKVFSTKTKLKEAINKVIKKDKSISSNTLSAIDKGINGYEEEIGSNTNITQGMITNLQALGFPPCNWSSVVGRKTNPANINSVVKVQLGKSVKELDKGYWETILEQSDKSGLDNLVCITLATENPDNLIEEAFFKAKEKLEEIEDFKFKYKRNFYEFMTDILDLDELDWESLKKKLNILSEK